MRHSETVLILSHADLSSSLFLPSHLQIEIPIQGAMWHRWTRAIRVLRMAHVRWMSMHVRIRALTLFRHSEGYKYYRIYYEFTWKSSLVNSDSKEFICCWGQVKHDVNITSNATWLAYLRWRNSDWFTKLLSTVVYFAQRLLHYVLSSSTWTPADFEMGQHFLALVPVGFACMSELVSESSHMHLYIT